MKKSGWVSLKKPQTFEVGQVVLITGSHSWAGERGEVIAIDKIAGWGNRPRVRLFDTCDQETYIMHDSDARILR